MFRRETYKGGQLIEVFDNRVLEEEKELKVAEVKAYAKEALNGTDWCVTRAAERGQVVDSDIITKREAIRTASNQAEAMIEACDELIKLDQCQWRQCFA